PRGAQDIRVPVAPFHHDHHHAQLVGPEIVGKGAAVLDPAAYEVAARILGPGLVDGAALVAAVVARLPGIHLVAVDDAGDPAVAARGAVTAGARGRLRDRDDRAMALLVFPPAAAGARIVAPDWHPQGPQESGFSILSNGGRAPRNTRQACALG